MFSFTVKKNVSRNEAKEKDYCVRGKETRDDFFSLRHHLHTRPFSYCKNHVCIHARFILKPYRTELRQSFPGQVEDDRGVQGKRHKVVQDSSPTA